MMNTIKSLKSMEIGCDKKASKPSSEIAELVRSNLTPKLLWEKLVTYHEKDIALALTELSREELQRLFRILDPKLTAGILEYTKNGSEYFELLNFRRRLDVLRLMDTAAAVDILESLGADERSSLLELLSPEECEKLSLFGSFAEDEVGSRMSANLVRIAEGSTVKEAMSELIRQAAENDNISTLYLVDSSGVFCGAIELKRLIIAREETPLSEITTISYPYLYARTSIDDCVPFFKDYSEESIPILDDDSRLIGVVTSQDFVEILGDELEEDYARLGGLSSEEDLAESVTKSVKKRMPWLCILLLMGLGVSATVGLFESIVAQLPVIICFQSLILDMAGNVGTQSLAVAIRVLMDTRIGHRQRASLVWKELRIGLLNGAILGALSFMVIGGYLCLKGNAVAFSFAVSGCLGLAMILAMIVSSLSGTLIPIFFKRVGIDPAVASGPLITTVNDLIAVVTYYGLSWLILIKVMRLV